MSMPVCSLSLARLVKSISAAIHSPHIQGLLSFSQAASTEDVMAAVGTAEAGMSMFVGVEVVLTDTAVVKNANLVGEEVIPRLKDRASHRASGVSGIGTRTQVEGGSCPPLS